MPKKPVIPCEHKTFGPGRILRKWRTNGSGQYEVFDVDFERGSVHTVLASPEFWISVPVWAEIVVIWNPPKRRRVKAAVIAEAEPEYEIGVFSPIDTPDVFSLEDDDGLAESELDDLDLVAAAD